MRDEALGNLPPDRCLSAGEPLLALPVGGARRGRRARPRAGGLLGLVDPPSARLTRPADWAGTAPAITARSRRGFPARAQRRSTARLIATAMMIKSPRTMSCQ